MSGIDRELYEELSEKEKEFCAKLAFFAGLSAAVYYFFFSEAMLSNLADWSPLARTAIIIGTLALGTPILAVVLGIPTYFFYLATDYVVGAVLSFFGEFAAAFLKLVRLGISFYASFKATEMALTYLFN
jgi:hypothetical protein